MRMMTLLGHGIIAEVVCYVKVRSFEWALIQYDYNLVKRGHVDTDVHTSCENEGGGQGGASASQRTPKIVSKPPDSGRGVRGRRPGRFSLTDPGRNQPCQHHELGLLSSEL